MNQKLHEKLNRMLGARTRGAQWCTALTELLEEIVATLDGAETDVLEAKVVPAKAKAKARR